MRHESTRSHVPSGNHDAPGHRELDVVRGREDTRVGRVLRVTGLAALPQLFNVLRGEMSLVGPRPTAVGVATDRLWYTARYEVRPGIVSAAQVSARATASFEDHLRLDLAYMRDRTIALDLQILLRAAGVVVLSGRHLVKPALDVTVSGVLLVVLSPIMLGLALAVRLTSPGAALFRQVRVGRHGRRFQIFKFRTMRADAESLLSVDPILFGAYVENDYKLPLATDPRLTPIGHWLRHTSLDELPQLVNVLRGDMSLVGPRPVVPAELAHYNGDAPTFLSVLPGITGAWQVSGRSDVRYPERCHIELEYIRTRSLQNDIVILGRTVGSVLSGRGAT
jgi:lipopolysaccharide/colanic/teichoic acid biosynthesis glycosyltransferase